MKKLMALGILASSFAFADQPSEVTSILKVPAVAERECEQPEVEPVIIEPIKSSYGYFCVGIGPLPIPAPLIGVGGRFQNGHHGFDGSLQVSSLVVVNTAKVNMNYLYYFNPNLDSQFYMGAGLGLMAGHSRPIHRKHIIDAGIAPQLVIGNQYTNKKGSMRHFQAEIIPPFPGILMFPIVTLSYGISF